MTGRDLEDVVRQALRAQAEGVRVAADALPRIQARTGRRHRAFVVSLAAFATAATAAAVAVLLAVGGPTRPVPPPQPPATQQPVTPVRLPIYYTATVGGEPVLYREFHPGNADLAEPASGPPARIEAAVRIMLTGRPYDRDYRSDWPGTVSVTGVSVGGDGVAAVELTGTMPTATAGATALQQLTWTVTAVAADRGVQLRGVRVRHDGADWTAAPLTRAPALDTLAPVWLISPQQGDTVGRTFDVHIAAVAGAEISLRVRDEAGAVVLEQAVTVRATPSPTTSRGEAHLPVTLPPGRYTLESFIVAPGGARLAPDDHTITVT